MQPQLPTQQPTQPLMQQHSNFAGLQRSFLTNTEPRPLLYHYTHLTNTKPRNAHNVPLVGVHLHDTTGDPNALTITDEEMRCHFEDLQWHHNHRAD